MSNPFFDRPILNSPYERPGRHWELDADGQPTQKIVEERRRAEFTSPIPKPKKRKSEQKELALEDQDGVSSEKHKSPQAIITELRTHVDQWRKLPQSASQVTPETARLLTHWRHHAFQGARPFFCQLEAAETAIWLTEVAPQSK